MYFRFRWVYCQLLYLRRCLPGRIRHALDELPETLDETYERALRDIDKSNWKLAHNLLQCVAVASRPLSLEELAGFLGFDFTAGPIPEYRQGWLLEDPMYAVLLTAPSLLAIVDYGGSPVIQFSHFSVKEFLMSSRLAEASDIILRRYHIHMTHAHTLAVQACLGILLHLDESITRADLERFPLAEYAAEHWVDHTRFQDVSRKVEDGMKQLFDPRKAHFAVWVWICDWEDIYCRPERRRERPSKPRGIPLHYAALCGLDIITQYLVIEHSQDVHSRGFRHMSTALHLASREGHVDVVRVLLGRGADVNVQNKDKSTPLHLASGVGRGEVVRVLLEHGADSDVEDRNNFTPIGSAIYGGHLEILRIYLEHENRFSDVTELHRASFVGNMETIRVLLNQGADGTARAGGWTPLEYAIFGGQGLLEPEPPPWQVFARQSRAKDGSMYPRVTSAPPRNSIHYTMKLSLVSPYE
jgi:hypothetical protein